MEIGMDIPNAVELYLAELSLDSNIKSGQTLASNCSAVADMLKKEGIVTNTLTEIYVPSVSNMIAGFRQLCESKMPEKRMRSRIGYHFQQFMLVIDHIRKRFVSDQILLIEMLAFAAFHFGAAPRVSEILFKPLGQQEKQRLAALGRDPNLGKAKGVRSDALAFLYEGKQIVASCHRPPPGAIAVGFFATGKRNTIGVTGLRGFPAAPEEVNKKYCMVKMMLDAARTFSPSPFGYFFDTFPHKACLIKELSSIMKLVALELGLDPKRFNMHCTRVGTISHLQEHGIDAHTQARHLGHASIDSKATYERASFANILGLQKAKYDVNVGNIDELRFVYMPSNGSSSFQSYDDEVQEDEEDL